MKKPSDKALELVCVDCGKAPSTIGCDCKCGQVGAIGKMTTRARFRAPYSLTRTIRGLRYIAKSPAQKFGGFDPETVRVAKAALFHLRAQRTAAQD